MSLFTVLPLLIILCQIQKTFALPIEPNYYLVSTLRCPMMEGGSIYKSPNNETDCSIDLSTESGNFFIDHETEIAFLWIFMLILLTYSLWLLDSEQRFDDVYDSFKRALRNIEVNGRMRGQGELWIKLRWIFTRKFLYMLLIIICATPGLLILIITCPIFPLYLCFTCKGKGFIWKFFAVHKYSSHDDADDLERGEAGNGENDIELNEMNDLGRKVVTRSQIEFFDYNEEELQLIARKFSMPYRGYYKLTNFEKYLKNDVDGERQDLSCVICLDEFRKYSRTGIIELPCLHMFHYKCLKKFRKVERRQRDAHGNAPMMRCPFCQLDLVRYFRYFVVNGLNPTEYAFENR